MDSPHKRPVLRKAFPCRDVIMIMSVPIFCNTWRVDKDVRANPQYAVNCPRFTQIVPQNICGNNRADSCAKIGLNISCLSKNSHDFLHRKIIANEDLFKIH